MAEYIEAETGKGADALDRRPQLAAALAAAKAAKCSVVVAKLDRLIARRGLCGRPDGPACAVHRCRAWAGCRSFHAAPLCGSGREGAAADIGADKGRAGGKKAAGATLGNPHNLAQAGSLGRATLIESAEVLAHKLAPALRAVQCRGRNYA